VPDRVALVETLTIDPEPADCWQSPGMEGSTSMGLHWTDTWGPSMHCSPAKHPGAVKGAIERLQLDINGSLGRLNPLTGADVTLKLEHPDLGKMLENLRLPIVATGTLKSTRGSRTPASSLSSMSTRNSETSRRNRTERSALSTAGSDLRFEVAVADAARSRRCSTLKACRLKALTVSAHVASSPEEIKLDEINARLAGAQVSGDGSIRMARERGADFRFKLGVENLMRLRKGCRSSL
jgi:hypothetical protein